MIDLVIAEQMWVHIDWRMSTTQNLINSIDPSNKSCTLTPMDRLQYTLVFSEYGYSATKGREMAHQHLGMDLLKKVQEEFGEVAKVELEPKLEGRQMTMVMAPR